MTCANSSELQQRNILRSLAVRKWIDFPRIHFLIYFLIRFPNTSWPWAWRYIHQVLVH